MEYVDRLLARGERYAELASRLETAITAALRTVPDRAGNLSGTALPRTEPTELPAAAAELIAATAGQLMFGELFGRLSAGARSLLARGSRLQRPGGGRDGRRAARPDRRVRGGRPAHRRLRPGRTSLGTPAQRGRW